MNSLRFKVGDTPRLVHAIIVQQEWMVGRRLKIIAVGPYPKSQPATLHLEDGSVALLPPLAIPADYALHIEDNLYTMAQDWQLEPSIETKQEDKELSHAL